MYQTVILSGGGTKGLCTLGALQYLWDTQRIGQTTRRWIGTSIGAIISYLIIIGYTPIEVVVYLCSRNVMESLSLNGWDSITTGRGIYDYSILSEWYHKMTLEKMDHLPTFLELRERFGKELIVCTYNFTKREKVLISADTHPNLVCLDALRMSSNLPLIFGECHYEGDEYIDGGIVENFCFSMIPVLPRVDDEPRKDVVGIYLNVNPLTDQRHDALEQAAPHTFAALVDKMYAVLMIPIKTHEQLVIKTVGEDHLSRLDLISIVANRVKVYTFHLPHSEKLELFSDGYNTAKGFFEKIITQ